MDFPRSRYVSYSVRPSRAGYLESVNTSIFCEKKYREITTVIETRFHGTVD